MAEEIDKPRGPGRPPGSQNKVGKDEKEFIRGLLSDTQEQYATYFMALANSQKVSEQRMFMNIRHEMSKMIVPRPTEVELSDPGKVMDSIAALFSSYSEDDPDDLSDME